MDMVDQARLIAWAMDHRSTKDVRDLLIAAGFAAEDVDERIYLEEREADMQRRGV